MQTMILGPSRVDTGAEGHTPKQRPRLHGGPGPRGALVFPTSTGV